MMLRIHHMRHSIGKSKQSQMIMSDSNHVEGRLKQVVKVCTRRNDGKQSDVDASVWISADDEAVAVCRWTIV
jgi:deferrochelatase/peroxidase EfeB